MTALKFDLSTIYVLWRRDLMRFFTQPSRLVGALFQPLILWFILGSGMAPTFGLPGVEVSYLEYFFPGVVMMVLVFSSIFSTISVIEDRSAGFMQMVLAGPGSRSALVIGKCLGSTTVALFQAALFVALAPVAGISLSGVAWPLLLSVMMLMSLGLTAFGFFVAWLINNTHGYHAIQMTILMPLWALSGAMFPPHTESSVFGLLMRFNPVAYGMTALRHAFYEGSAPASTVLNMTPEAALITVAAFALVCLVAAMLCCEQRRYFATLLLAL